ncbi:O-antigen/teichoic acid export membrane protein [Bradyrhizobium sp. R2.2-H]|jgi:O-antigen/teichoic acid export membrane protein|nr:MULTISPECIES: oligosaccharide flippase family protein [unclassified Bradyrhizobium]TCU64662.1 O-antigen/teichoic acid export membrane protein [Bradyrhizobium sp. Y-H1]TCU66851.1 O-antigen/teichoic acid export membrane protein [Bradyrhizobium sp. R2.2-H]
MLKQLIRNTLISSAAFGIAAVLGLVVIPVIIRTWGVTEFGLIVLARILLPSGMMGLLDLGLSEVTTQAVARAREHRNWRIAGQQLALLTVMALGLAGLLAVTIWISAPYLTIALRVDAAHADRFAQILRYTALANVVLIPALVWEGIVKGFERYNVLRLAEVSSTIAYVACTIWAANTAASFEVVAYIYLASTLMRACLAFAAAFVAVVRKVKLAMWDAPIRRELFYRCALFAQGKLTGGLALPIQPFLVGLLFGPKGVGIYDTLVRLPRVSKVVVGLLTSALLPVASRLDERGNAATFQRLGEFGLIILPMFTVPPLMAAAVLSREIMQLWIGPQMAPYAFWMGLGFVVPICAQYLAFGNVMFLTRTDVQSRLNRLMIYQLAVWAAVAVATLHLFDERALILGQVVANAVILPLQVGTVSRALQLDSHRLLRALLVQAAILVVLGLLLLKLAEYLAIDGFWGLGLAIASFCVVSWTAQFFLVLEDRQRAIFAELGQRLGWAST